jgi:hypothetical protein
MRERERERERDAIIMPEIMNSATADPQSSRVRVTAGRFRISMFWIDGTLNRSLICLTIAA